MGKCITINKFDPSKWMTYDWQIDLEENLEFTINRKASVAFSNDIRNACHQEPIKIYFRDVLAKNKRGRQTERALSNYRYQTPEGCKKERIRYIINKDRVGVTTILHEVAHSLLGEAFYGNNANPYGDRIVHGPTFRRVLAELFEKYLGIDQNYSEKFASKMRSPLTLVPKIGILKDNIPFLNYADINPIVTDIVINESGYYCREKSKTYKITWEALIEKNLQKTSQQQINKKT